MVFNIGDKAVGEGAGAFIIAELSANHNQSFEIAVQSVHAAKEAGADAIKLQTYTADTITIDSDLECFKIKGGTLWDGNTLYQLYQKAYTPWNWQPELKKIAEEIGLICFSSPFDNTAVDFLEEMKVPAYKIASFEITDIPLIEYVASKKKPVIISTGIASIEDIHEAIDACKRMGNNQIALLKCTSEYPAAIEDANLLSIPYLSNTFGTITGLSDHTLGSTVAVAAVVLGARIIEKHFILDKKIGGPDAAFSLDPAEFKQMVHEIRTTEKTLGRATIELTEKTIANRRFARSLFVVRNIEAGEEFTKENIRSIRPNNGLHPKYFTQILGKTAKKSISRGTPLAWDMIL
jgi:pseudaminic acid synthase